MKTGIKQLVFVASLLILVPACFVGVTYRQTLKGIYEGTLSRWPEEAYRGKPLEELQKDLGLSLEWCGPFEGPTGLILKPDQRVMRFDMGKPFPYFHVGTAQNAGYVVIQTSTNGDIVVEILRTCDIDSP